MVAPGWDSSSSVRAESPLEGERTASIRCERFLSRSWWHAAAQGRCWTCYDAGLSDEAEGFGQLWGADEELPPEESDVSSHG